MRNMRNVIIHLGMWLLAFAVPAAHAELRLGIEPRGSAEETRSAFAPLAEYLARELGEPVRLVIADDFTDYGRKLQAREFDLTFAAPATILYSMELAGPELAAVAAVLDGKADAAGVGDVVFNKLKGKLDLSSLRVLSTSPATPNWVMVNLRAGKTAELKRALLKLEPGSAIAKPVMGDKGFVGFQDIGVGELEFLKTAVRAAKDR